MSYTKKDNSKLMPLIFQAALYSTGIFFLFIPLVFGTLWTMFGLSVAVRYVMEISIAIGLILGNIIANNNSDKDGGASHRNIVAFISVIVFLTYTIFSYNNFKSIEKEAEKERREKERQEKESEEVEEKGKEKATLDDRCFIYGYRSTKSNAERLKGKSVRKHTVPDVCKGRESTRRGSRLYTNGNVNLDL